MSTYNDNHNDNNDNNDHDDLGTQTTLGAGTYQRTIEKKRTSVFHQDAPKIHSFTYVNHQQIQDPILPEAYENFASLTSAKGRRWETSRQVFFEDTRIGASRDDPAIFVDPEANNEDDYHKRLSQMDSKERRKEYLKSRRFEPPPIVPSFTSDVSFLKPAPVKHKFGPSIFNEHPQELFSAKRKGLVPLNEDEEGEGEEGGEATGGTLGVKREEELPTEEPLARRSLQRQQERAARLSKARDEALDEWLSHHNPSHFSKLLSRLHKAKRDAAADDDTATIDTFQLVFGTNAEKEGRYQPFVTPLDESLYFGEAARLRFFGKYHELAASIEREGRCGLGLSPVQDYHLQLSPRTRFITRYVEAFGSMPLPIVIRAEAEAMEDNEDEENDDEGQGRETELNLAGMCLGDDYVLLLSEVLADLPRLSSINLSGNKLTDASMYTVVEVLANVHSITGLTLSENKIDSATATALGHLLTSPVATIATLRLSSADFDDAEIAIFMLSLTKNSSIKLLDLAGNLIGGAVNEQQPQAQHQQAHQKQQQQKGQTQKCGGCEAIASALCYNKSIESLNLNWNRIGPTSATYLARGIAATTSLLELHLAYNAIKDRGAEAVGGALMESTSLRVVDLSGNQISFVGCFVLSWALRENRRLRLLDLSANPIGHRGARALMRALNAVYDHSSNGAGDKGDRQLLLSKCTFTEPTSEQQQQQPAQEERKRREYADLDLQFPAAEYSLDLARVYDRCVALELLAQASVRRGCVLRRVAHLPVAETRASRPKPSVVPLDLPPRHAQVLGPAYGPWRQASPRRPHPYALLEADEWDEKVRQALALQSGERAWVPPRSGTLLVDMTYEPLPASPAEALNATGLRRMLRIVSSLSSEMRLSDIWAMLQDLVLETHQLERLLDLFPGSKYRLEQVELLSKLLPCVRDTSNTEALLKRFFANDVASVLAEVRHLMHGALCFVCLGAPTGHFKLDFSNSCDRLAAVRLAEIDNEERAWITRAMPRWVAAPGAGTGAAGPSSHGFTAQYQDRSNFRNEVFTGRARFVAAPAPTAGAAAGAPGAGSRTGEEDTTKPRPHQALNTAGYLSRGLVDRVPGTAEFDFVSTSRPAEGVPAAADAEFRQALLTRRVGSADAAWARALDLGLDQEEAGVDVDVDVDVDVHVDEGEETKADAGADAAAEGTQLSLLKSLAKSRQRQRGSGGVWVSQSSGQALKSGLRSDKDRADVEADRAVYFVDDDGAASRLVFRAAVRLHSCDVALLSASDIQRRIDVANRKLARLTTHPRLSRKNSSRSSKRGGLKRTKSFKAMHPEAVAEAEAGAKAGAEAAELGVGAESEEEVGRNAEAEVEVEADAGEEAEAVAEAGEEAEAEAEAEVDEEAGEAEAEAVNGADADAEAEAEVEEAGKEHDTTSALKALSSPAPSPPPSPPPSPTTTPKSAGRRLAASSGPPGCVLEGCLAFNRVPTEDHGISRLSLQHTGVGLSLSPHIVAQRLVSPESPAVGMKPHELADVFDPTHARFGLGCSPYYIQGQGGFRMVLHGTEIILELPVAVASSRQATRALVRDSLRLLFGGFLADEGEGGEWLRVTHESTVEGDRDALTGAKTTAALGLHVVTRRLDVQLPRLPHARGLGFKTVSGGGDALEVVWRWRAIKPDHDRDPLCPGSDEATYDTHSIAPRCWGLRLAALRHCISGMWLSAQQAAWLVQQWPLPLREDVAVALFSRCVDLENWNDVVDVVYQSSLQSGPLYRRLGHLNVINPSRLRGRYFELRFNVPEERCVAHSLLCLHNSSLAPTGGEGGDANAVPLLRGVAFRRDAKAPLVPANFQIPATWQPIPLAVAFDATTPWPGIPVEGIFTCRVGLPDPSEEGPEGILRLRTANAYYLLSVPRGR